MKTVIELTEGLDFPVKLEQAASGQFRVTYGKQVKSRLEYSDAVREFGACVFHSLACAGKLDNSKEDDRLMYQNPDAS
jgi:hypothetical protein